MDNYFNSPNLAHFLKTEGTNCIGTVHVNRKNVPSLEKKKLKNEETAGKHLTDAAVLAWQDKKRVKHLFQPAIMVR
jgi:hypothetical protein